MNRILLCTKIKHEKGAGLGSTFNFQSKSSQVKTESLRPPNGKYSECRWGKFHLVTTGTTHARAQAPVEHTHLPSQDQRASSATATAAQRRPNHGGAHQPRACSPDGECIGVMSITLSIVPEHARSNFAFLREHCISFVCTRGRPLLSCPSQLVLRGMDGESLETKWVAYR